MGFLPDQKEKMTNGKTYFFIPKHRGKGFPDASKWIIKTKKEYEMACDSMGKDYVEKEGIKEQSYNLSRINNQLEIIGKNRINEELKLCKFVCKDGYEWHGYPADYCRNNQDRPTTSTLEKLHRDGVIDSSEMVKITKGKKGI